MLSKHVDTQKLVDEARSSLRDNPHLHAPSYGARYFNEPVPKYTLPKESMPAHVAYQIVHDEMNLDGNPAQNMATFVTTWMEPEAQKLCSETRHKNFIDYDEYPQTQEIHQRCVSMIADLFHAPSAMGTSTVGSSEAFMLAGLAMKFNWRNQRKSKGLATDKPNIVMGHNAQIALVKFAKYFDVEERLVPVTKESHFAMGVQEALKLVDENTIGVVAILGSTFTGYFEPVKELNDALQKLNAEKGWNVPIHVDAASGGFIAPFYHPELEWDFKLPLVKSINVSGHKFGLVYPGLGWCIWRSKDVVPDDLVFHINYLGGNFPSFTLNFSRSSSEVIGQYYNFLRLGFKGYKAIIETCMNNALLLEKCLKQTKYFKVYSNAKQGVPLVAFSLLPETEVSFSEHDLSHKIRERGWIVPAYNLPKNCENINVLRIVVRESHSEDLIESLMRDIVWAFETLREGSHQGDGKEKEKTKSHGKEGKEHEHEHATLYKRTC